MIPLKEVVLDYMTEEERSSMHKYPTYLHHALTGYRDLHYDVTGVPKEIEIDVDTNTNIVPLPIGVIKIVRVSIPVAGGRLITLDEDGSIFRSKDDCGNDGAINSSSSADASVGGVGDYPNTYGDHWRNGQNIGNYFGIGGHQPAAYKYSQENNHIELSTYFNSSTVVVEYMSDIEKAGDDFLVHEFLREPIKNWIDWKRNVRKPSVSRGEKKALQMDYVNSKTWARMRIGGIGNEEAKTVDRKSFKQSPKF